MSIHSLAVVDPRAEIGPDVTIGPFCVVHEDVRLERGVVLDSHVTVYPGTTLGEGTRVYPQAVIGGDPQSLPFDKRVKTYTRIGKACEIRECATVHRATADGGATVVGDGTLLMAYSHLGHDCQVGKGVVITSFAGISGHCVIEDYAIISGFVAVHQKVRVGTMAMIGGVSRVPTDCAPYILWQGVPIEPRGLNRVGLRRRGVPRESVSALDDCYRLLYRSGLNTSQALDRIAAEVPQCPEVVHLVEFLGRVGEGAKGRALEG